MSTPFVQATNLRRVFDVSKPWLNRVIEGGHLEFLKAVDGVTFDIRKGATPTSSPAACASASSLRSRSAPSRS